MRIKAATLREAMLALASERGAAKSVDPMEVAVRVAGKDEKVWRRLMKPIRDEATRLALDRRIIVLRKGRPIDPEAIRGLWRFRIRGAEEADPMFTGGAGAGSFDEDDGRA